MFSYTISSNSQRLLVIFSRAIIIEVHGEQNNVFLSCPPSVCLIKGEIFWYPTCGKDDCVTYVVQQMTPNNNLQSIAYSTWYWTDQKF